MYTFLYFRTRLGMKHLYFVILFIVFAINAIAQDTTTFKSPYRLAWQVDIPIATLALGTGISYLILDANTKPLTESYIYSLNRNDIWGVDRDATYNWSKPISLTSDVLLGVSIALPFVLLADKKIRKDVLKIAIIYAETFALCQGLTNLTKNLVKRPRPFLYNEMVDISEKHEKDAQYSFFSGHVSTTAAMCFMTAKIFHDYNKGSKAVPWVWAAAATVPVVEGILRQQAGKHFWTDIVTGYLIGAAVGILVPELHRKSLFEKKKVAKPGVEF